MPKVPEPIEFDPFEMDWPWPGMQSAEPEASAAETEPRPEEKPSEQPAINFEELR